MQSNLLQYKFRLQKRNIGNGYLGKQKQKIQCRLYITKKEKKEMPKIKRKKALPKDKPPPNNYTLSSFYESMYDVISFLCLVCIHIMNNHAHFRKKKI